MFYYVLEWYNVYTDELVYNLKSGNFETKEKLFEKLEKDLNEFKKADSFYLIDCDGKSISIPNCKNFYMKAKVYEIS